MRYITLRLTYLLTYLLTYYRHRQHQQQHQWLLFTDHCRVITFKLHV